MVEKSKLDESLENYQQNPFKRCSIVYCHEDYLSNANYWYQTAGESAFNGTMEEEWEKLSIALLND